MNTCCPECGTFPGGAPRLVYNRLGDNTPCLTCGGKGWVTGEYSVYEPPTAGREECPVCYPRKPMRKLTRAERLAIETFIAEVPV